MKYEKVEIKNGKMVITESKEIDQNKLTSDCWLIQFSGLSACENCDLLDTPSCGGQIIRKQENTRPYTCKIYNEENCWCGVFAM